MAVSSPFSPRAFWKNSSAWRAISCAPRMAALAIIFDIFSRLPCYSFCSMSDTTPFIGNTRSPSGVKFRFPVFRFRVLIALLRDKRQHVGKSKITIQQALFDGSYVHLLAHQRRVNARVFDLADEHHADHRVVAQDNLAEDVLLSHMPNQRRVSRLARLDEPDGNQGQAEKFGRVHAHGA